MNGRGEKDTPPTVRSPTEDGLAASGARNSGIPAFEHAL